MTEISDRDVRDAVDARLRHTVGVHAERVGVSVHGGVLILSGHLDSFTEKGLIQRAAAVAPGVRAIVDQLTVRDNLGAVLDADIALQVADIVARVSGGGSGAAVVACVHRGVVMLTGTVASAFDRDNLVGCVSDLDNVIRVDDNVRIDPAAASQDIRRAITSRLVHNAQTDSNHIEVEVADGVVTLSGTVRSSDESRQAERVARQAPRIRDVHNRLRIGR